MRRKPVTELDMLAARADAIGGHESSQEELVYWATRVGVSREEIDAAPTWHDVAALITARMNSKPGYTPT